jgi:hypothetical protein
LKFIWKISDIPYIKVCSNHGPWGLGGATRGETVFACVDMGNIFQKFSDEEPLRQKNLNLQESFMM